MRCLSYETSFCKVFFILMASSLVFRECIMYQMYSSSHVMPHSSVKASAQGMLEMRFRTLDAPCHASSVLHAWCSLCSTGWSLPLRQHTSVSQLRSSFHLSFVSTRLFSSICLSLLLRSSLLMVTMNFCMRQMSFRYASCLLLYSLARWKRFCCSPTTPFFGRNATMPSSIICLAPCL